jgi:hypothetical protein
MFSIPAVREDGYSRGFIAIGVPGLVKTTLNIHQIGKTVTINQSKAVIHLAIFPRASRRRQGEERDMLAIYVPFL